MKALKWLIVFLGLDAFRRLVTMVISGTMAESDLVKMKDAVVEINVGGDGVGSWVAIESWSNTVEPTRAEVPMGSEFTLDGEQHNTIGTPGTDSVRATFFFTEGTTDPFYNLYTLRGTAVDLRWSKSGSPNDLRFTTANGILTAAPPPGFNAAGNENAKCTIGIVCTDIDMDVIPT